MSTISSSRYCSQSTCDFCKNADKTIVVFWWYGGMVVCEVTGRSKYEKGMEVLCMYSVLDMTS